MTKYTQTGFLKYYILIFIINKIEKLHTLYIIDKHCLLSI